MIITDVPHTRPVKVVCLNVLRAQSQFNSFVDQFTDITGNPCTSCKRVQWNISYKVGSCAVIEIQISTYPAVKNTEIQTHVNSARRLPTQRPVGVSGNHKRISGNY